MIKGSVNAHISLLLELVFNLNCNKRQGQGQGQGTLLSSTIEISL